MITSLILRTIGLATVVGALMLPVGARAKTRWVGIASYYGAVGYPRMSAAHRSLPFGTRVRVTNLRTGSGVEVVIADRGPFIRGRIIDLSRAAAGELGMLSAGVVPVEVALVLDEIERLVRCPGKLATANPRPVVPDGAAPADDYFIRKSTGWSTILMYRGNPGIASIAAPWQSRPAAPPSSQ